MTSALAAESNYPADIAKRAAIRWGHTQLVTCPTCHGPALVGYLDGEPVAYACHMCGPIDGKRNPALDERIQSVNTVAACPADAN